MGSLTLEGTTVGFQSNLLLKAESTQNSEVVSQGLENLQKLDSIRPLQTADPKLDYPPSEFIFPRIQADPLLPSSSLSITCVLLLWTSLWAWSPPLLWWKVGKQCQDQTGCCGENKDIRTQGLRKGIR